MLEEVKIAAVDDALALPAVLVRKAIPPFYLFTFV